MSSVALKLQELNISIPEAAKAAANYVPYIISGNQIIISGQLPIENGKIEDSSKGKLGLNLSVEEGQKIAKKCAINIIGQVCSALNGELDRAKCLKIGVFVNSAPDFTDQPKVANGASDLLAEAFGENGIHARSAVGVAALPFDVAVEVEAVFEIL